MLKLTLSVIIESTRNLVSRFDFLKKFSESLSQDKMETFSNLSDQRRTQSAGVRALRHRRSSYIRGHLPGVPDECETKYVPNAINFLQFVSCQLNFTNLHSKFNTKYFNEIEIEIKWK